jgi:lysozyme C
VYKPAALLAFASLIVASVAGCAADTASEDADGVGESQDHLLSGPRLTPAQVAGYLRQAGFPESTIGPMVCTSKYESSFYTHATNKNTNGTTDYGLFQINSIHLRDGAGCPSSSTALFDPVTNTRCALHVYKIQGINAWYGYQHHRSECSVAKAPASAGAPAPTPTPTPKPTPAGGDTPDDTADPNADNGGGCWSATLGDMEDANACVQSASNGIWYQCHDGSWYRGVSGSSGPYGACTSKHPLQ